MASLEDLEKHLKAKLADLNGKWVVQNSGYERRFVDLINAELSEKGVKFWDCTWKEIRIEVKKCKDHSWLNLLRYADYILSKHCYHKSY